MRTYTYTNQVSIASNAEKHQHQQSGNVIIHKLGSEISEEEASPS